MKIEDATTSIVSEIWQKIAPQVKKSNFLEEGAQELASVIHSRFDESVVIARVFFTVPFDSLPAASKEFVKNLAEGAGAGAQIKGTTPVLTLVGTHGVEEDWKDRRRSRGHAGIPLISSAFVGAIPMISRLLKELGVPMDWVDSHDSEIIKKAVRGTVGVFFVDDAAEATDHEGRGDRPRGKEDYRGAGLRSKIRRKERFRHRRGLRQRPDARHGGLLP
jgi:hypothetical protein